MTSAVGNTAVYDRRLDPINREIRLLTLLPTDLESRLVFAKLETVSLTPDLEYIALSYAWGDPKVSLHVFVNDQAFGVTVNLGLALWYFKRYNLLRGIPDGRPLRLWVDAVCINQNDLDERAQQVTFMKEIYSKATHVFSWLGAPGRRRIDLAIDTINDLVSSLFANGYRRSDADSDVDSSDSSGWETMSDDSLQSNDIEGPEERLQYSHHDPPHKTSKTHKDRIDDKRISPTSGHISQFQKSNESNSRLDRFRLEISSRPELCLEDSNNQMCNIIWNTIDSLHFADYWDRLWVYQEMALANDDDDGHHLFSGSSSVSIHNVKRFMDLCYELGGSAERPFGMHENVWISLTTLLFTHIRTEVYRVLALREARFGMVYQKWELILLLARNCSAVDPRDMLYGLVAVLGLDMQPNYLKSVKDVYLEGCVSLYRGLNGRKADLQEYLWDLLQYAGGQRDFHSDDDAHLPSWIPNLGMLQETNTSFRRFTPLSSLGYDFVTTDNFQLSATGVMRIHGFVYGAIENVYPCPANWMFFGNDPSSILGHFYRTLSNMIEGHIWKSGTKATNLDCTPEEVIIHSAFRGVPVPYKRNERLAKGGWLFFWKIMQNYVAIAEIIGLERSHGKPSASTAKDHPPINSDIHKDIIEEASLRNIITRSDWTIFLYRLRDHLFRINDCPFFRMGNGYIGVGPSSLRATDSICIFDGVKAPVILRKVEGHWIYAGLCYVYGVSYEEHTDIAGRGEVVEQWFDIH